MRIFAEMATGGYDGGEIDGLALELQNLVVEEPVGGSGKLSFAPQVWGNRTFNVANCTIGFQFPNQVIQMAKLAVSSV